MLSITSFSYLSNETIEPSLEILFLKRGFVMELSKLLVNRGRCSILIDKIDPNKRRRLFCLNGLVMCGAS